MGFKANRSQSKQQADRVMVKYVRKARMWARTEFKDGKQIITWHESKPSVGGTE